MFYNNHLHRKQLLLNFINHFGPISRIELIELTDYRPATIGDIIKELLSEKLIIETGFSSTGHGRKRTMLEINKQYLCAIGISFSLKCATCIISQFDGTILHKETINLFSDVSKEEIIDKISNNINNLITTFHSKKIIGIGISDPPHDPTSYRSSNTLFSNYVHFDDWINLNLKAKLESCTGLPIEIYNRNAMPAVAEQRFGNAKGVDNFFCIEISNGIGMSIFCNGKPIIGSQGMAGELGHTVIDYHNPSQKICYCGKPGCVESNTSYPALVAKITAAINQGVFSVLNSYPECSENITIQSIRRALDEGDRLCLYCVKEFATNLGVAIANAVNLLNPELVIFHGFVLELGNYFLEHLKLSLRENVLSLVNNFDIRVTESIDNILSLGAVAKIFSSFIQEDNFKWIYQLTSYDAQNSKL